MTEQKIDARGLQCPAPVLKVRSALSNADVQCVVVTLDNEDSAENVTRTGRSLGCEVSFEQLGDDYIVTLTREAGISVANQPTVDELCPVSGDGENTVAVFITSDTIGKGDDSLGRLLMIAFTKTVLEMTPLPKTVALMNGGVKLVSQQSELAQTFAKLESKGTEILVCGTCLDFFKLKDQLAVGTISNMYDILNSLYTADRIVKP